MGRETIGDCSTSGRSPELDDYEMELAIQFIKQECGEPQDEVDVQISSEDHELGSYPVIAVVWDDCTAGLPDDYISKCIEAFERFDRPEEIHKEARERARVLHEIQYGMADWFDAA
jgi:hypothetical protein